MVKGLWVTEKSGHTGEGNQASEETNVTCDSEGRRAAPPSETRLQARQPAPPALPPQLGPASLELLGNELLVVKVAQPLLLHQGALSLQRVLMPPRHL